MSRFYPVHLMITVFGCGAESGQDNSSITSKEKIEKTPEENPSQEPKLQAAGGIISQPVKQEMRKFQSGTVWVVGDYHAFTPYHVVAGSTDQGRTFTDHQTFVSAAKPFSVVELAQKPFVQLFGWTWAKIGAQTQGLRFPSTVESDSLKVFLQLTGRGSEGAALMTELASHSDAGPLGVSWRMSPRRCSARPPGREPARKPPPQPTT